MSITADRGLSSKIAPRYPGTTSPANTHPNHSVSTQDISTPMSTGVMRDWSNPEVGKMGSIRRTTLFLSKPLASTPHYRAGIRHASPRYAQDFARPQLSDARTNAVGEGVRSGS